MKEISELGFEDKTEFKLIYLWILGIKGETQEALLLADESLNSPSLTIQPLHPDFLMMRGFLLSRMGSPEKPIEDCEAAYSIFRVQKREFEAGRSAIILGHHFLFLGKYQKALDWFSRAEVIFNSRDLKRKKLF